MIVKMLKIDNIHKIPKIMTVATTFALITTGTTVGFILTNGGDDEVRGTDTPVEVEEPEKPEEEKKEVATETEKKEEEKETEPGAREEEREISKTTDEKGSVVVTKSVTTEEEIAFGVETQLEVNLPRGEVRVAREGVPGRKRIVSEVVYKDDVLVSSEVVSTSVVAEPVNQINAIGISDYNLNDSYVQLYPYATIFRENKTAPATMIGVDGNYYLDFWRDPVSWVRMAPASAVLVSGGSFVYDGKNYEYALGPVDTGYALTEAFCIEYKLACGRW